MMDREFLKASLERCTKEHLINMILEQYDGLDKIAHDIADAISKD